MARKKQHINRTALENAVATVEGGNSPPSTLQQLYTRVVKELATHNIPATPGAVMGRIKDYGIKVKTKPARVRQKWDGVFKENTSETEPETPDPDSPEHPANEGNTGFPPNFSNTGMPLPDGHVVLDVTPYTKRGINVDSLADLFTSSLRDDASNIAIMGAIIAVRKQAGLPALSREDFLRLNLDKQKAERT